jgi:hypothetical protein
MKILEKYDGTKTYMFASNELATPEIIEARNPAVTSFTHVVETDEGGEVCLAVMNLSRLCSLYGVDPSLPEGEAIQAVQDAMNAPPPEPEVTAEERIAAAMEFQNLLNL